MKNKIWSNRVRDAISRLPKSVKLNENAVVPLEKLDSKDTCGVAEHVYHLCRVSTRGS